jgi:hypothetical protein
MLVYHVIHFFSSPLRLDRFKSPPILHVSEYRRLSLDVKSTTISISSEIKNEWNISSAPICDVALAHSDNFCFIICAAEELYNLYPSSNLRITKSTRMSLAEHVLHFGEIN